MLTGAPWSSWVRALRTLTEPAENCQRAADMFLARTAAGSVARRRLAAVGAVCRSASRTGEYRRTGLDPFDRQTLRFAHGGVPVRGSDGRPAAAPG